MDNITLGSYVPGKTIGHKLDPRIKLFYNIIFIVMLFLTESFIKIALISIPWLFLFFISIRNPKKIFKIFLTVLFIGFFLFLINSFLAGGTNSEKNVPISNNFEYKKIWKFKITLNVIRMTLLIMLRIFIMIVATTVLISTTKPADLTKAIEDFLTPLRIFRINTKIISMIISLSLRFIPTLLSETQRIMKAQASRGVDFKNGGVKSKIKSLITLLIPLFVSSFSKAEDLSNAMETRGYNPYGVRSKYREYKMKTWDWIFIVIITLSLGFIIASMPSVSGEVFKSLTNLIFTFKK